MKQHSFTARLKSLALVFSIALAFASCANEDVAQDSTNPEEDNDKSLTTFVAGDETKTRTSMDYTSGDFYWEAGDYIYVKDDNNVWQKSRNAPTSKVAAFKYKVPGKFTGNSYKVYYLGKYSNATDKKVTISATQEQSKPDNTEHFGTSGDYGTATANKIAGKQQFKFELEHQPAYLVFQPYTNNTILHDCFLTKIEVTSDNDITETYTIDPSTGNLNGSAGGKQIVLTTGDWMSGIYPNGFPLTNNAASVTTNGAYMVIKPGTHTLKVRYWVRDVTTWVEGTITKLLPPTVFASNTYYDVTANLNVKDYDGDHYYMWDAQKQYWKGHEWNNGGSQPTLENQPASNDYPQNNTDSRYYNEVASISSKATQSCATLPNINEMLWYAKKGDPRWDGDELWTTMGHLYRGGMWFKKKTYISGFSATNSPDGSNYLRSSGISLTWQVSTNTPPSAAEVSQYFYLPALGRYDEGKLKNVGYEGRYWSSDNAPNGLTAYNLYFSGNEIGVHNRGRTYGYRIGEFK